MTARTLSVLLLSLALVAPMAGDASAGARQKAPAARKAKGKKKQARKARAKVKAKSTARTTGSPADRGSRLRSKLFGRNSAKAKKAQNKKPNFLTKRQAVRDRQAKTKTALKEGRVSDAAVSASRSLDRDSRGKFVERGIKKLTMRERFAMWRNARKVRKSATRLARKRSKAGDIQGTKDALQGLKTLEKGGRLGVVGRWKKARAEKRAFKNSFRAARKSLRKGDAKGASELQQFASGMRGGTRAERRQLRKLAKDAVKLAKSYAKQGNPEATWQALNMSAELNQLAGRKHNAKQYERIMTRSFTTGATILVKEAKADYKARNFDDAAVKLAEANNIQRSVEVKLSRRTRRTARRLTRKLGPRVTKAQAAATRSSLTTSGEASLEALNQAAAGGKTMKHGNTSEQVMLSNGSR
ncbi:MAG: hypothetical protein KJO07_13680 [Deltaproteobacteria bacterium]|nr:hypothetical protein [Deltaproteobacteria bacterium]